MAGIMFAKTKRKDLEEIYDEFAEFSLSSPARKIRRLDAELPPIIEEEQGICSTFEQKIPGEHQDCKTVKMITSIDEEMSQPSVNEERSIVLYKPVDALLFQSPSPSNLSIKMNSDLFSVFKNKNFCPKNESYSTNIVQEEVDSDNHESNRCLAVIPWASQSHLPSNEITEIPDAQSKTPEPMETEVVEYSGMDVEEEIFPAEQYVPGNSFRKAPIDMPPWQPHCMNPHLPQNYSHPVTWSW